MDTFDYKFFYIRYGRVLGQADRNAMHTFVTKYRDMVARGRRGSHFADCSWSHSSEGPESCGCAHVIQYMKRMYELAQEYGPASSRCLVEMPSKSS